MLLDDTGVTGTAAAFLRADVRGDANKLLTMTGVAAGSGISSFLCVSRRRGEVRSRDDELAAARRLPFTLRSVSIFHKQ